MDIAEQRLHAALAHIPAPTRAKLWQYTQGLLRWNQAYNLTAIRDPEAIVSRHLLDSASIVEEVRGRLLDVGTGAGLPGMVLAILRPQMEVTLLDSNGKKIRFLRQMVSELALAHVQVVQARVEDPDTQLYDTISSRAFASLRDMAEGCLHRLAPGGRLLAMKGKYPADELQQLPAHLQVQVQRLQVAHLDEERHLIILSRVGDER